MAYPVIKGELTPESVTSSAPEPEIPPETPTNLPLPIGTIAEVRHTVDARLRKGAVVARRIHPTVLGTVDTIQYKLGILVPSKASITLVWVKWPGKEMVMPVPPEDLEVITIN